jgi:hypothetical protein
MSGNPVSIFISYARKDEAFMRELVSYLYPLQRDGLISSWYDGQILPGEEWAPQIKQNLEQAQVILLLISKDFLNSDYCYEIELTKAIERHKLRAASVIPVILRSCLWDQVSIGGFRLSNLQALPKDAKPISRWDDPDDAFTDVAKGLLDRIQQLDQARQQAEQQRQAACEQQRQQAELEKRQRQAKIEAERKQRTAEESKHRRQEAEENNPRPRSSETKGQKSSLNLKYAHPRRSSQPVTDKISRRNFIYNFIPQSFLTWLGGAGILAVIVQGLIYIFVPNLLRKESLSTTAANDNRVYGSLEELLRTSQWEEADRETLNVMLKIANREEEGWLDSESLQNFPCDALGKIDQLWVEASDGKFGFSVQEKIYVEDCGGTLDGEYDETAWYCFGEK